MGSRAPQDIESSTFGVIATMDDAEYGNSNPWLVAAKPGVPPERFLVI